MAKKVRMAIVDSYAIMADLLGQAPPSAIYYLDMIKLGEITGYLHYLLIYELAYHWRKGRLPFTDSMELLEFVNAYFKILNVTPETALLASEIKVKGDNILRSASDPSLRRRKLSIADATSIAISKELGIPIITGDRDLTYVARAMKVDVLWR